MIQANVRSDKTNELLQMYQKDIEELRLRLSAYELETEGKNITTMTEGPDIRKVLEERIKLLTNMLFARHKEEDEPKGKELWSEGAGDLIVDNKLVASKRLNETLNTSSDLALIRMKEMHKEKDKQQHYIEELLHKNQYLTDSKQNVRDI